MNSIKNVSLYQSSFDRYVYYLFLLFTISRPISLIFFKVPFFLEMYAVGFGYLFLILALISFRRIEIDRTCFIILLYISFCLLSFSWGSEYKEFVKSIIPLVFLFFVKAFIFEKKKIDLFFSYYQIGFILPLFISTVFIILGLNIDMHEFYGDVPRHAGAYYGSHNLAYQMLLFVFVFCFNYYLSDLKFQKTRLFSILMAFFSIYCLYQSHTRTAFIGLIIFLTIFLYGVKKKHFVIFLGIIFFVAIAFSSQITNIFLKQKTNPDINVATSGRIEIWDSYFDAFLNSSIPEQVLGKGIGWKLAGPGAHNDWLRLLTQIGIVGIFLYGSIMISVMYDIYLCTNYKVKYFFGAAILTLIIMGFGSNVVIAFPEIGMFMWTIIGFYYILKKSPTNNVQRT